MSQGQKYCPNGHLMDPSWNVCPYCPSAGAEPMPTSSDEALKKTVREVAPGVPERPAAPPPRKTMRMDERKPPLVGWIVDLDGE